MRQGFVNVFRYITELLQAKTIPNTDNVLFLQRSENEWPPCTRDSLQRGGTVHAVLQVCVDNAMDQDFYLGNGAPNQIHQESVDALPFCRNEGEFVFARCMCQKIESQLDEMNLRVGMGGIS